MANSYNVLPVYIDSVMASGFRALQTLNTGQWGFRVAKVVWTGATAQGHTFVIVEPKSSAVLLQGQADADLADVCYDFDIPQAWRDFKVTTLASGILQIWYRP